MINSKKVSFFVLLITISAISFFPIFQSVPLLRVPVVFAGSSGPNSPGTMANETLSEEYSDWSSPNNAKVEDGSVTWATTDSSPQPCLSPDTVVSTDQGDREIKDLKVGDTVYSYNFASKKIESKEVVNVVSTPIVEAGNQYYHIYFNGGSIRATYDEPFYVGNEVVEARDLKIGDELSDISGLQQTIVNIKIEENYIDYVWDISVKDNYNFFANSILVHNTGATYDNIVKLVKGGVIDSTNKASLVAWPGSLGYTTYGGSHDLWGQTLTASDINSSGFGVAISAKGVGFGVDQTTNYLKATNFGFSITEGVTISGIKVEIKKNSSGNARVDHIRITIYYNQPLGSGTEGDPYKITTCQELQSMSDDLSSYYTLNNNIDCTTDTHSGGALYNSGAGFAPIGDDSTPFTGNFDGNDKTITGLLIDRSETDYIGLFGFVGSGGVVENVGLESIDVSGNASVGGLVGQNYDGAISNSYSYGDVTGEDDRIGGLIGYNNQGTVSGSYSTADVTGSGDYVGGLIGYNNIGTVSSSYSTADVTGSGDYVGGLIGYDDQGTISNTYSTGDVEGADYVGGLVGEHQNSTMGNSSPLVYPWNGKEYVYAVDVGSMLPKELDGLDVAKIDSKDVAPKDGKYSFKISEEYNEIVYYDELALITVDHQPGYSVVEPLDRTAGVDDLRTVSNTPTHPLISCIDDQGKDCLDDLKSYDDKWSYANENGAYDEKNFKKYWILDFGDLSNATDIQLVLRGARDYATSQKYPGNNARSIQVKDANGNWVDAYDKSQLGSDGSPRLRTLNMAGKFLTNDYRIRVAFDTFNANYFAVDTTPQQEYTINTHSPSSADLQFFGYTAIDKTYYWNHDYSKVSSVPDEPFAVQKGNFTRYGDVNELLQSTNNQFVVMHSGDQMSVEFPYVAPANGQERDFFLYNYVFYKFANIGPLGRVVDPLPFLGMSDYPYPPSESYPLTPENLDYLGNYNTRVITNLNSSGSGGKGGAHTIINSYSASDVTGENYVGGLVGYLRYEYVFNSYATGTVISDSYGGGLVGVVSYADGESPDDYIYNSGWLTTSADDAVGGETIDDASFDAVDYSPTHSKSDASWFYTSTQDIYTTSFTDPEVASAWDFATPVWYAYSNNYPKLYAPPVQSSWSPATTSTITDTTQTITFTTDENATCYLSLDGDEAYADMSDDTLCTGGGTTSQSCTTPDLGADGAKTVYAACFGGNDNADTAGTNTALSYTLDTTAPVQSSWHPADGSNIDDAALPVTLTLDEAGDCRLSLSDESYDNMSDNIDCTGDSTTSIKCIATGLGAIGHQSDLYIACQDTLGHKDIAGTNTHLAYTLASGNGSGGGSGANNASNPPLPPPVETPTPPAPTPTGGGPGNDDLAARIAALQAEIQRLQALIQQIRSQQGNGATQDMLTLPLRLGFRGPQVTLLQNILKKLNFFPQTTASNGYFGPATLKAVQDLQVKYNIAKPGDTGYGNVGPKTRAMLNGLNR